MPVKYTVQRIQEKHREIIRLLILGYKGVEIAQALDISTDVVTYVKNSPITRQYMEALQSKRDAIVLTRPIGIEDRLKDLQVKAVGLIESILDANEVSPAVRLKAAEGILDRSGHSAPKVLKGQVIHTHLTATDIEELKRTARQRMMEVTPIKVLENQVSGSEQETTQFREQGAAQEAMA